MNRQIKIEHDNCLERYMRYVEGKYIGSSIKTRKAAIKQFFKFLSARELFIREINHVNVEDFLIDRNESELSNFTVNNYYSYLKGFFKFCETYEYNKMIDFGKVNYTRVLRSDFNIFSSEEIIELFNIISNEKKLDKRNFDKVIFKILFYTGCTLGELYSLKIFESLNDVIDEDYFITLNEKKIYFYGSNERVIVLPDSIISDIIDYRNSISNKLDRSIPNGAPLFITTYGKAKSIRPVYYSTIQDRMAIIKKKSSFKSKNLSIKNIRHTVIKAMVDLDIPLHTIGEAVGIDIATLKIYTQSTESKVEVSSVFLEHPLKILNSII